MPADRPQHRPVTSLRGCRRSVLRAARVFGATLVGVLLAAGCGTSGEPSGTPTASTAAPTRGSAATVDGPTTSTAPIVYPANTAVSTEIAIRQHVHGCWEDAQPGTPSGAYRQDYFYPAGQPCAGSGWVIDVELFNRPQPTEAAVQAAPNRAALYEDSNTLVVVTATAPAGLQRAVAGLAGMVPASR